MTEDVDICNRALSEIGARTIISAISDTTAAGKQCSIWYNVVRKQLLRAAPWGFARKTLALTTLGLLSDDPPASPYPWLAKYAYPTDCLKVNYILPPPPTNVNGSIAPSTGAFIVPWCKPSRSFQFIPAYDDSGETPVRVLLANITDALGVYVVDVVDPGLMDVGFKDAFVAALAARLVMPLTGNAGMRTSFIQQAQMTIAEARAQNANEAISSSDHTPDWIAARGIPAVFNGQQPLPFGGMWYSGYDDINWGM